jgi:hypothetical protein
MKTGFFEESEGVRSVTRLIMVVGCLWALAAASVLVWRGTAPFDVATFVTMVVGVFMGGKVLQGALSENKQNK